MIEMLKARKEQLEARGEKGFTLMEMLIVIAIIAILIAIAIPVFTSQLNRANASTDLANIRSGYAQVQTDVMLNRPGATVYGLNADATVVDGEQGSYVCKGASEDAGEFDIAGLTSTDVSWSANDHIYYKVNADGSLDSISTTNS